MNRKARRTAAAKAGIKKQYPNQLRKLQCERLKLSQRAQWMMELDWLMHALASIPAVPK